VPVTPWNIIAVVIALRAIAALTALLLCASPVGAQTEVEKPPAVEKPAETTLPRREIWVSPDRPGRQRLGPTVTTFRPAATSRP